MERIRQEHVDAVVIGAGPAGATAAIALRKLGWRVLLVERGPRNRGKTCGHCLNPRAESILQRCGVFDDVARTCVGRTRRLHVLGAGPRPIDVSIERAAGPGWLVDRRVFDQVLIDAAAACGVDVAQPASARLLSMNRRWADVELRAGDGAARTIRAGLVVGADGLRSRVGRAAGIAAPRAGRKFGFSFDVEPNAPGRFEPGAVEMFVGPGGYLGVVRQSDGRLHLAGLVGPDAQGARRSPRGFVQDLAERHGALRAALGGPDFEMTDFFGAGPMPCRPDRVARGRVALVGDAAGYHEPFTGEGIAWGLESAETLAEVCRRTGVDDFARRGAALYARRWAQRVGRRQRACRALSGALERPLVLSAAARAAGAWSGIGDLAMRRLVAT